MEKRKLEDYVTSIPDFPKEGVIFRDITSVIENPEGFRMAVDELQKLLDGVDFDLIVAAESRGFVFGAPLAYNNGKGLVLVRKKGKLPRETISCSYDLEYGEATLEVHKDAVKKGQKIILIDDLLATGGTLEAMASLVEELGGEVVKMLCLIELPQLGGREKLKNWEIGTVISFDGD